MKKNKLDILKSILLVTIGLSSISNAQDINRMGEENFKNMLNELKQENKVTNQEELKRIYLKLKQENKVVTTPPTTKQTCNVKKINTKHSQNKINNTPDLDMLTIQHQKVNNMIKRENKIYKRKLKKEKIINRKRNNKMSFEHKKLKVLKAVNQVETCVLMSEDMNELKNCSYKIRNYYDKMDKIKKRMKKNR